MAFAVLIELYSILAVATVKPFFMQPKQTRNALTFLISFLILVICTACPYKSAYPLTGKTIVYDATFNGSWKNDDAELTISNIDAYNFHFYYNDYDPDFGAGEIKGKGYVISHAGSQFVVAEQATNPKSYLIFKIVSIRPNTVKINELKEALVGGRTFRSEALFTKFVQENINAISASRVKTFTRTRQAGSK